jgi:hypothetical protein
MHVTQQGDHAPVRPNAAGVLGEAGEPAVDLKKHPAVRELLGATLINRIGSAFEPMAPDPFASRLALRAKLIAADAR